MAKKRNILIVVAVAFLIILIFLINKKVLADGSGQKNTIASEHNEAISKEEKTEANFETSVYQVEEILEAEETSVFVQKEVPKATENDETYMDSAESFINRFHEDYPNSEIVKIRWQLEPSLVFTYVIEGLNPKNNKEKYVVKMIGTDEIFVLGRDVEYNTDSDDIRGDVSFTPLDMEGVLTINQVRTIVEEDENNMIVTMSIQWKFGRQIILVEVEEQSTKKRKLIFLDSKTGEILNYK